MTFVSIHSQLKKYFLDENINSHDEYKPTKGPFETASVNKFSKPYPEYDSY